MTIYNSAEFATTRVVYDQELTFDFTVIDPCLTTVYDVLTIPGITQEAGQTTTEAFVDPDHSAGTEVGDQTICGAITYELVEVDDSTGFETAQDFGFVEAIDSTNY